MKEKISLFRNISEEEYDRMMVCFKVVEKCYDAEETICSCWETKKRIGYVQSGEIIIVKNHQDGRQTIIEYLQKGDVFGAPLSTVSYEGGEFYVICKRECKVHWIDYEHLIKRCPKACSFHSQIVDNALEILSDKAVSLSARLDILSQRTIRDKLICFFDQQRAKQKSMVIELPFSLGMLADYLSVDRSAMMRELKKLKTEKKITSEKNKITLLY